MRPDDLALAEHPEQFERLRAPGAAVGFGIAAIVMLGLTIAAIVGFEAIDAWISDYSGRRSWPKPLFAPLVVVLAAAATVSFALRAIRAGRWRRRDGRWLRQRGVAISCDLNDAYARLSTGDPAIYRPLPVGQQSNARLRWYEVDGEPTTYLTLSVGKGKREQHWPMLTFQGAAHDAFAAARKHLHRKPRG